MSATSSAMPRSRTSSAPTTTPARSGRKIPFADVGSHCAHGVSMTATTSSSAARSARLPEPRRPPSHRDARTHLSRPGYRRPGPTARMGFPRPIPVPPTTPDPSGVRGAGSSRTDPRLLRIPARPPSDPGRDRGWRDTRRRCRGGTTKSEDAPAVEDLVGKLASQHQVIGDALAGLLFGKPVERFDPRRGEREQVVSSPLRTANVSPWRARAAAIAATASSTETSHGRPTPSATGGAGTGRVAGTRGRWSCAPC